MARYSRAVSRSNGSIAPEWVPTGSVAVRVPGATHMAKHTRGLVARAVSQSSADPRSPEALAALLREDHGFTVALHPPSSARAPHVLDVTAPTG